MHAGEQLPFPYIRSFTVHRAMAHRNETQAHPVADFRSDPADRQGLSSFQQPPRKRALLDDQKACEIFKLRGRTLPSDRSLGASSSLFTARSIFVSQVS